MPHPRVVSAALTLLALLTPTAPAGSIFDDDWKPPQRTETPDRPQPTPRPAPQRTPTTPAATPAPAPPKPAPPRPVPAQPDQAKSRTLMREVFAKDLADKTPAARRALAEKLLAEANRLADNPVDRYVVLGGAYEAAREAASLPLAFRAADELARAFTIDPLALKTEALLKTPVKAPAPNQTADNLRAGVAHMDDLVLVNDLAAAARVGAALLPAASADPALRAALQERVRDVDQLRQSAAKLAAHEEKLKSAPDDPAANLAVGSDLCFAKSQWERGLPHLAKGADPTLKQLAADELARPAPGEPLARLGDGWWDAAAKVPAAYRPSVRAHAADCYDRALPAVTGLRRTLLEKRIAELSTGATPGAVTAAPGAADNDTVGYTDLFDKITVPRWRRLNTPRDPATWAVENGLLIGAGGRGSIYTPTAEFQNFRLRAELLIEPGASAGIVLRALASPTGLSNYQVAIEGAPNAANPTGTLLSRRTGLPPARLPATNAPAKPLPTPAGRWFTLDVTAQGPKFTVLIDNQKVADYHDPDNQFPQGAIGLQHLEGGPLKIRSLRLKELPPPPRNNLTKT